MMPLSSHPGATKLLIRQASILLLVFLSILMIMQWRLWPEYTTELEESFHGIASAFDARPINEIAFILNQLRENGTTPCHHEQTNFTLISNLHRETYDANSFPLRFSTNAPHLVDSYAPDGTMLLRFSTNALHTILMDSYTADGTVRCSGGDYYETILYNEKWRSRPRVQDFGNGSYGISFFVDSHFEGLFNFSASLLFRNFHGLDNMTRSWDVRAQVAFFQVEFLNVDIEAPRPFRMCNNLDGNHFQQREWDGRWTREWVNSSCVPDEEGRFYECVSEENEECINSGHYGRVRCSGRVSRLESNGWVYSQADCGFRIFEAEEAWDCLSDRWLLFWGDSNFQDTIRNLMLFVLDIPVPYWSTLSKFQLPRNMEEYFVNQERPDQAVHVSLIFNGHSQEWGENLGLDSLEDSTYREYIAQHFKGNFHSPDVVIMNSGLHDGKRFNNVTSYMTSVHRAMDFWKGLLESLPPSKRSQVLYRTTVAPAGKSRGMPSNPHNMEVFNKIMVDKLLASIPSARIVDAFDMTFPFHFNNDYSDGGHYGRAPNAGQPHQYFVDLMLVHVILNSICPIPS